MALKGTIKFTTSGLGTQTNTNLYLDWEVVKQSVSDLHSTINYTVYASTTGNGISGISFEKINEVKQDNLEINLDNDGSKTKVTTFQEIEYTNNQSLKFIITGFLMLGGSVGTTRVTWNATLTKGTVDKIEPTMYVQTATNFNDEENPAITYKYTYVPEGYDKIAGFDYSYYDVKTVEACISFTGGEDNVTYREITKPSKHITSASYTFKLTEEERKILRAGVTSGDKKVVRFYIRTTFKDGVRRWNYADATITLINHIPTLAPVIRDVNPLTLAVTGDETKVIKGRSNVYFETGATARKEAVIATHLVTNGTNAVKNQPNGIIEAIESNVFVFNATDSRGINAETATLELEALPYIPLTCHQKIDMELISGTDTAARVTISGNYFNGSFGAVQNELKLEIRRSGDDIRGLTEWVDVTPLLPDISDNTYTLSFNVEGLNGGTAYDFQCRATDKLGTVETPVYTARLTPIFDWSETDFNFNVPVNIEGDLTVAGSLTTGDGSSFLLPYILSDTTTDGNIELNDNVSNYEYIEVFYTDNNGKSGGYTRFIPPAPGTTLELSLSLIQAANDSTYIRRTGYKCKDNKLEVNAAFTGYCWIRNAEITHATDKNYLKVVRVVGYK